MNEPVVPASLPRLGDHEFVRVDPNLLRVSLLTMGAFAGIVAIAGSAGSLLLARQGSSGSWLPVIVAACLVALTCLAAVLRIVEIRHIGYQVRAHDISYRSGVWVRRVSTVPFVRVQHARVRHGPIQRRFAIATLEVNSAGPDLMIHGLPSATADQLKALVIERAGALSDSG